MSLKRLIRERLLQPEEAAAVAEVRAAVEEEFPKSTWQCNLCYSPSARFSGTYDEARAFYETHHRPVCTGLLRS